MVTRITCPAKDASLNLKGDVRYASHWSRSINPRERPVWVNSSQSTSTIPKTRFLLRESLQLDAISTTGQRNADFHILSFASQVLLWQQRNLTDYVAVLA